MQTEHARRVSTASGSIAHKHAAYAGASLRQMLFGLQHLLGVRLLVGPCLGEKVVHDMGTNVMVDLVEDAIVPV